MNRVSLSSLQRKFAAITPSAAWLGSLALLSLYSGANFLWSVTKVRPNAYYAATVISMSKNWTNLLFGAADPAGTVSLDKIPGSFWLPAVLTHFFGFSNYTVIVVNGVLSLGTVLMVTVTARHLVGPVYALISGAAVATVPVFVAVSRSNQPEAMFMFTVAVSAYFAVRALIGHDFKWLLLTSLAIGWAFQSYMLIAWSALPALFLTYWLTSPRRLKAFWETASAFASTVAFSLSWIIVVTLTPRHLRPYVGGSDHNSAWEMVFGYNGVGRFESGAGKPGQAIRSFVPHFSGPPSPVRFFNEQMAGQISWLILPTAVSIVYLLLQRKNRTHVYFLGGWFLTQYLMFSLVAGMHQFYTCPMGITMGLILAMAIKHATEQSHRMLLTVFVVLSIFSCDFVTFTFFDYLPWIWMSQLAIALVSAAVLHQAKFRKVALAPMVALSLLWAPACWSFATIMHPSSMNPSAGPHDALGGNARHQSALDPKNASAGLTSITDKEDQEILTYLDRHGDSYRYKAAIFSAMCAAPFTQMSNGANFIAIGGFLGLDPSFSVHRLSQLLETHQLKFVVDQLSAVHLGNSALDQRLESLETWVKTHMRDIHLGKQTTDLYVWN